MAVVEFGEKIIGKRGWFVTQKINYPYGTNASRTRHAFGKSDRLKSENLLDQTGESEGRFADRTGSQLQVVRIGRVAPNAIRLAAPRRRTLPGHPLLQRRKIGGAASRDDLERHLDEPGVDRRKRQLFGINDARHAGLQLTWQRALRIRNFACRYCASQHDCRDSHRFHGEFR